jgi:hypothetical protein
MGTPLTTFDIFSQAIAAKDEHGKIRVSFFGVGGSMTGITVLALDPSGITRDITSTFNDISSSLGVTFISVFEAGFVFQKSGHYTFFIWDSVSGAVFASHTAVAEWATRIDVPVSEMAKLLTSVSALRTLIRKG